MGERKRRNVLVHNHDAVKSERKSSLMATEDLTDEPANAIATDTIGHLAGGRDAKSGPSVIGTIPKDQRKVRGMDPHPF
jgi:hypothetical protein